MTLAKKTLAAIDERIKSTVAEVIKAQFDHYLKDISFRIEQAYDLVDRVGAGVTERGKVYAEDLNLLGRHAITGYTLTNNSPVAGSIAWADLKMVYSGSNYDIANGNSAMKYIWWSPTTTPLALQSSNTKPVLGPGEVLLFLNTAGSGKVMLSDTNASLPTAIGDGSVDSGAIIAKAVTQTALGDKVVGSGQLGDLAVTAGKINAGAVNSSNLFTNGVVNSTVLGDNAVVAGKIATGGISAAGQFANGVVNTAAIGDDQIVTAKIAQNAVGTTELALNAVDSTILKDGAVSTANKLGSGVVTDTKLASGAVTPTKLNVLRHFLY